MHATEDKKRKEEVEERNLADSAAYRAEKSMADLGDKITSEQRSELEAKIADVRAALSTDDVERIKSAREALGQAFYHISEAIYRRDPDDNGIELYRDRPEEEWPRAEDGSMSMVSEPLDLRALLAEAD